MVQSNNDIVMFASLGALIRCVSPCLRLRTFGEQPRTRTMGCRRSDNKKLLFDFDLDSKGSHKLIAHRGHLAGVGEEEPRLMTRLD